MRSAFYFSDEGFAAEPVAIRLREAEFHVERFYDWFRDAEGRVRRNVLDPAILQFCHKQGWLLVTRDSDMRNLHRDELRRSGIAVLATAHNKQAEQKEWVEALVGMQVQVLREHKKRERPWFATFSRAGKMTFHPL